MEVSSMSPRHSPGTLHSGPSSASGPESKGSAHLSLHYTFDLWMQRDTRTSRSSDMLMMLSGTVGAKLGAQVTSSAETEVCGVLIATTPAKDQGRLLL